MSYPKPKRFLPAKKRCEQSFVKEWELLRSTKNMVASNKEKWKMGQISFQELLKDKRMRFAMSIINSAYASDSLDRLRIQRPVSDRYYLPMEIRYLAGADGDPPHRAFGFL